MKKNNFILLSAMLLTISSCSYFDGIFSPDLNNQGSLIIPSTTSSSSINTSTSSSSSSGSASKTHYSILHEAMQIDDDFHVGLPASGDIRVLVIPVEIGNDKFSEEELNRINLGFNGTSEETGFESVSSYYQKTSKGLLNITADISPIYSTGKSKSTFESSYKRGADIDCNILDHALTLLADIYDLSNYDYNNDSYLDGIYLIYSCDYSNDIDSPWWAWCNDFSDNGGKYDDKKTNLFVWASIEFFNDPIGDNKHISLNAETIIHETGHLLGLDDYYDYDESIGPKGGLGGAAMMDNNVGDHDSFSKLLLGWADYTVVKKAGTYKIGPSESTNQCLIIPLREHQHDILGEYLLIDYYTPTGLNALQAGSYGLFTKAGVRIYHIDARIDPNVGNQKNRLGYYSIFSFNNSDTNHKLIKMIEYDNNNSIAQAELASNTDLFPSNSTFRSFYSYDNVSLKYIISIGTIGDEVEITITNKEEK